MIVIVAIPSEDDYVWKVSSEKVPHMTLLALGEHPENLNMAEIATYLEHATKTTMCRFGLDVDRRGELGENNADVLFFGNYGIKKLLEFRHFLLTNSEINKGHNSMVQFPEWIPHLTLGFPETPAKPINRDYGIQWVNFDRIALWDGDYSGPEFVLKRYDSSDEEMSMSDDVSNLLAHYGIRGMRWGVRRNRTQIDSSSEDHRSAQTARGKAKKHGVKALSNKELQDLVTRMNLEKQYASVVPPSRGKRALAAGAKFTGDVLLGVGKQQATKLAADQSGKLIAQLLKSKK